MLANIRHNKELYEPNRTQILESYIYHWPENVVSKYHQVWAGQRFLQLK